MTAAYHARTVRRGVVDVEVLLAGAGVGVAPTVDSANYVESVTRTGPGRLVFTLKAGHTALLAYLGGVQKDDLDATPARKTVMAGATSIKSNRTIEVLLCDGDQSRQVDEWTDPLAAAPAGLKAATATVASVVALTAADLLTAGKNELLARPRNITFTTAGGTAADAPANAVIVGTDINGDALTETVTLAQTATTASGVKAFRTIETITYPAADGAGATVSVGYGSVFGLSKKIRTRAGALMFGKEISAGSVVTNGVLASPTTSPPNGSYAPNSAPDGVKDYALEYEPDGTGKDLATGETVVLYLRLTQAVGLV